MKIGLVCPYNIFRGGGVQEHVLAQAEQLRKFGHEVRIITPRPWRFEDDPPKDVIFVGNSTNVKTPISTSAEVSINLSPEAIEAMLAEEKFTLLHVHEPEVPLLGGQIIAKATSPVVATFHAVYPDTLMAWMLEAVRIPYSKSIFSRLTAITAVSDVAGNFVHEHTQREVTIIPNGIDLHKYVPATKQQPSSEPTILYIGRLEKRKGVRYLLATFELLVAQHPEVHLVIGGDGPEREKLEYFVESREIPNVTFLGFVDEAEKLRLLDEATLFCSPAIYGESFGIVLLEAMAKGIVTVAGDNPGYRGVLTDRGAISIVNPKDKASFVRRLELLLFDEEVRSLWQEWAAQTIGKYNYEKVVKSYEKLYKQTLRDI